MTFYTLLYNIVEGPLWNENIDVKYDFWCVFLIFYLMFIFYRVKYVACHLHPKMGLYTNTLNSTGKFVQNTSLSSFCGLHYSICIYQNIVGLIKTRVLRNVSFCGPEFSQEFPPSPFSLEDQWEVSTHTQKHAHSITPFIHIL